MDSSKFLSVSEVNGYIKTYLENNYFLQDIYVKGEISNFKRHQSGTLYFSIKDASSRINIVMFANYAMRLKAPIKDGSLVLIHGRLSVYEAGGSYQIQATEILFDSIGQLYLEYERLKKQLEAEGLFDLKYKKELPSYPKQIGIITAPYGAAIHDMVNTIQNRWPLAEIILFPSLVQGTSAAKSLVKQIQVADYYGVDVIICGRGGGSIEDLWPFNEEIVARAIFDCRTPIISAVGHQSDYTIADFVADKRGLTPTDGAIQATPKKEVELEKIKKLKQQLQHSLSVIIENKKTKINSLKNAYVFLHPEKLYDAYRLKLDYLETTLQTCIHHEVTKTKQVIAVNFDQLQHLIKNILQKKQSAFVAQVAKLDALSPLKVLKRGYGMVFNGPKNIKSIHEIAENEILQIKLHDGQIYSKVIKKEEK